MDTSEIKIGPARFKCVLSTGSGLEQLVPHEISTGSPYRRPSHSGESTGEALVLRRQINSNCLRGNGSPRVRCLEAEKESTSGRG